MRKPSLREDVSQTWSKLADGARDQLTHPALCQLRWRRRKRRREDAQSKSRQNDASKITLWNQMPAGSSHQITIAGATLAQICGQLTRL